MPKVVWQELWILTNACEHSHRLPATIHIITYTPFISTSGALDTRIPPDFLSTMSMSLQQLQAEGVCLRFPENLQPHASLSQIEAAQMLTRAIQLSTHVAYQWTYIDKPHVEFLSMCYMRPDVCMPSVALGTRSRRSEIRLYPQLRRDKRVPRSPPVPLTQGRSPAARPRALFARSVIASVFSLINADEPCSHHLYSHHFVFLRPVAAIPPLLMNQPARPYPLRMINEPPMFVLGEKAGQKVIPHNGLQGLSGVPPAPSQVPQNLHFGGRDPQAMLAQQNREMEALERRSLRERSASMNQMPQRPQPQARIDEEDSTDEIDHISTRTLAMTRYKRNHDFMHEVFMYAAFGDKQNEKPTPAYSIFNKTELEDKVSNLTAEIEALRAKAAARQAARDETQNVDVSMETSADISFSVDAPPSGGETIAT
ncbi:hypothetical protein EW146_g4421 [Bondarzewia mesenterica]|uniref:Uncharacterized protein n=1 Tax=Bondarzewia mesenterica TaxID=1095465 RepID=A0A4S4LUK5_9AGAM|nr:hypothetical protein EW146_g4421 [Bondarzewia mesenterica]